MAGPDKEEPVNTVAPRDIPAKASPPREKSPPPQIDEKPSVSNTTSPPDGGWGWAVVFASFMIHIIGMFFHLKLMLLQSQGEPCQLPISGKSINSIYDRVLK